MTTLRASAYRALASESRVQLLHILQASDRPRRVDDLAAELGLHVNTTREHLDRLIDSGFVARGSEHLGTRGRPRKVYRAVDRPAATTVDTRARDLLMQVLLEGYGRPAPDGDPASDAATAPRPAAGPRAEAGPRAAARAAAAAGERWAGRLPTQRTAVEDRPAPDPVLTQFAALEQHFEDLGFDPDADTRQLRIHLRRCPLRDLAVQRTEVVCSVHLGLARGVLAAQGGPLVAERLEPFVGPQHCVLHLAAG